MRLLRLLLAYNVTQHVASLLSITPFASLPQLNANGWRLLSCMLALRLVWLSIFAKNIVFWVFKPLYDTLAVTLVLWPVSPEKGAKNGFFVSGCLSACANGWRCCWSAHVSEKGLKVHKSTIKERAPHLRLILCRCATIKSATAGKANGLQRM